SKQCVENDRIVAGNTDETGVGKVDRLANLCERVGAEDSCPYIVEGTHPLQFIAIGFYHSLLIARLIPKSQNTDDLISATGDCKLIDTEIARSITGEVLCSIGWEKLFALPTL